MPLSNILALEHKQTLISSRRDRIGRNSDASFAPLQDMSTVTKAARQRRNPRAKAAKTVKSFPYPSYPSSKYTKQTPLFPPLTTNLAARSLPSPQCQLPPTTISHSMPSTRPNRRPRNSVLCHPLISITIYINVNLRIRHLVHARDTREVRARGRLGPAAGNCQLRALGIPLRGVGRVDG